MKKIDVSIPRRMFWSDKLVNKKKCPLCHSILENEYQTYAMAVWSGRGPESFITGNDYGAFCPECPVVVLDKKGFGTVVAEMAERSDWGTLDAFQFAVIGIVNMDAIPEDKRQLPPGDDGEPISVVEFLLE